MLNGITAFCENALFLLNLIRYSRAKIRQTKYIVSMMNKDYEFLVFLGFGHMPYRENALYLYISYSLLPCLIRQTEKIEMMSKRGSTEIVNFVTSGQGFLCYIMAIRYHKRKFRTQCVHVGKSCLS